MRGIFLIVVLISLLLGGMIAIRKPTATNNKAHAVADAAADATTAAQSEEGAVDTAALDAPRAASGLRAEVERNIKAQKATEREALQVGAE